MREKPFFTFPHTRTHARTHAHLHTHSPPPIFSPPPFKPPGLSLKIPSAPIINTDNVRLHPIPVLHAATQCPYPPSAASPATLASRTSAPSSTSTYSKPRPPALAPAMPTPAAPVRIEEDLRSLRGLVRMAGREEDPVRPVARSRRRRRRKEASRLRAPRPYRRPDSKAHSSHIRRAAPGASPASRTAISTGGGRPRSAAATSRTVANPPSRCLPWRRPPSFLPPAPVRPALMAQVAAPPLPVPSNCMFRQTHRDTRI